MDEQNKIQASKDDENPKNTLILTLIWTDKFHTLAEFNNQAYN